nr:substrate-binding domain-containing protein [Microbacterium bovistercoris]
MTQHTRPRRLRAAATALVAAGALALAGCASTPTGDPTGSGTPSAGQCGSVPNVGANDPDGLLKDLPEKIQAGYNAYPLKIEKSAWSDWKSDKTSGFTAAIVGQAPAAPFIAAFQKQLAESLTAEGVKIVANLAPNDPTDVPGQIQMFNQALSLKPDVIFFNAAAPESSVTLAKQAYDAGIPVISMVATLDSPYAITVAFNTPLQAMETGAGVLGAIGGKGSVLEVNGIPGIPSQTLWEAGSKAVLDLCPDVKVAGQVQGLYQPPAAQQAVVQYLATNPAGVDGVLQAGTMGLAIRDGFTQAGLTPPPIQDISASQGMIAYAAANPSYPYFGTATPPIPQAKATAQIGLKVLEGAGPKINHIVWAPYYIDRSQIADLVDPSWAESDSSDLAPAGVYFTDDDIAQFFNDPKRGPQTTK